MAKRSFYIRESELDDYQTKVVQRRTDRSFIVKGCAGSGKSILALWKVKQIQEENKGTYYFIVFTKTLKKYMEDGIREIGLNNSKVVYHKEWEKYGSPAADYLVVDEAQDFSKEDIQTLMAKSNKALIMYGDSAQQLYAFRKENPPISIEETAVLTKYPTEQLMFNHRLPKKIARFAEYVESNGDELEERCKIEGTEKPKVLKYRNLEEQLDQIIEIVKNRGYDDVGILFPKNDHVEYAYNYFNRKNFGTEAKYRESMNLNFDNSLPKLTTYHSSKGLQFEAVFLPDCEENLVFNQNALYVALTRTYQDLFILHSGNLTDYIDKIPQDLYDTSLITDDIDW